MKLPKRIAKISHAEQMTSCHRSTLRRWWESGLFPAPQKLNGKTLVWSVDVIEKWIDENLKGGVNHE